MNEMAYTEIEALAQSFNLPELNLSLAQPCTLTLDGQYNFSLEYNQTSELLVILKMPLMPYELNKLTSALRQVSFLTRPQGDIAVAYSKDHLVLISNLGQAAKCTASQVKSAILNLINFYKNLHEA